MDCGPTCLRMIAKYHGKSYSLPFLRERCYIDRAGVSLRGITEAAELIGFRTLAVKIPLKESKGIPSLIEAPLPCIVHWDQNHFVVVYKITKSSVYIADPGAGKVKLSHSDFLLHYRSDGNTGISLLIETTPEFYASQYSEDEKQGFRFLFAYLRVHRKLIFQLVLGLLLGTIFQLIFPFLTQSLVDIGIDTQNLRFIYLVLIGQLMLFVGQTVVQFIQSWILLHMSVRINVSLISDFLRKLMKLPLVFFDAKNIGDLLQRIGDHKRIETFLSRTTLAVLLSTVNLLVFGLVLAIYSVPIFLVFLISSLIYLGYVLDYD